MCGRMKPNLLLAILALPGVLLAPGVVAQEATNRPVRALPGQLTVVPAASESSNAPVASPPTFQGISRPMTLPSVPALELPPGVLAFDRDVAAVTVTDGAPEARFVFHFTNTSPAQIAITNVAVSCGCTAVDLPPLPWTLKPGDSGRLPVTLEVAGKSGDITKSLQVRTDRGIKTIFVKADVQPPAAAE